jgi:ParB-like chromosome segregation protein Spo0J
MAKKSPSPQLGTLRIERVKLVRMNPAPYNPRVALSPGDPEYKRLRKSVLAFGYVDPLVWNMRYTVLFNENVKEADVSVVELDLPAEKALNLALNKIKGRWDDEGLAALLKDLRADNSIDTALSGFDAKELDRILNDGDRLVEMILPEAKPEEPEPVDSKEMKCKDSYRLSVECNTRKAQDRLFKRLSAEGYGCKKVS